MPKFDDFDPSYYMSTPRLDVPSLIALGQKLLQAAPGGLPKAAEGSKASLQTAIEALLHRWQSGPQNDPAQRMRPVDVAADTSWACIKGRLEPHAWLDPARFPDATVARELLAKLFPSGLAFTQLEYAAQWAEATRRIHLIEDGGMEPTLRRLCGDVFVDELLHWHSEYTKMIGAVSEPEPAATTGGATGDALGSLHVFRRQAAQAILAWQVQMVALHLTGHPGAREALHPTDDCRNLPRS